MNEKKITFMIPSNPKMNGNVDWQTLHNIIHNYKSLSYLESSCLLMEISVLIGMKDKKMQERVEHLSKVYAKDISA